ncbi:outer membrane lipid asymmetry maintenance protein MlaD [Oceanomicrobium pacificus]|uniref:Outer membrane lipid asymmetry maintenance protein MlaD n=1 Tax=Oceanomicrobium pacificus TaxID=2692916 RepID=A0A6B0TPG4_9RHOB|nr:outer membrane lipid asymmetry maintenance protein MlaD [Oceanomicrobium pacificus]MXU65796.1 outer membrane lipid asymmetry maintenance protein MlaD [Oceanomicrobium pacificus]
MANNVAETLIGAAVLAVAGGFLVYAAQTTGLSSGGDSYSLTANFRSIEGVSVGTDVRVAGVKVGRVTAIDLNPTTYEAVTSFSVSADIQLPDDSDVKISTEGLLGGNYVDITPGGSEFLLADGDEILNTQGAVSFLNLLMKFASGND